MPAVLQPIAALPNSGNATAQLAQQVPGFDASAAIAAQEQGLSEYLNRPVQEILAQLGLPALPSLPPVAPPPDAGPANPIDPGALIKPVTDALGTLGTGMFDGLDPTQMFQGISRAFNSSATDVSSALGNLAGNWEGAGGTAAAAKTATALDNGAEVNAQAAALQSSLATATAAVQQAEARLIEIISQFVATMIAIGPSIIFPWGWAAAIAAANEAVTRATETMTELQAELAGQSEQVTATGKPVEVTEAPTASTLPAHLGSTAAPSSASAMSQGLSSLMDTAIQAAQTGSQTATELASQLGSLGSGAAPPVDAVPIDASTAGALSAAPALGAGGGGGAGAGGGAAGAGLGANTLAARAVPPMPPVSAEVSRTVAASLPPGAAGYGPGMGMGGAPMAPMAHGARVGSGGHSAPAFLQTTDHGDEIVGDLGTAAPPVIGETEQIAVKGKST
jgi:hypothetical protein